MTRITPDLRAAWSPLTKQTVSEWADENRILPANSPKPGRWSTNWTPYLRGIMDTMNDPNISEVTAMLGSQIGKTEALLNMFGWLMQHDPSNALYVAARDEDARHMLADRILPMVRAAPELANLLSDRKADATQRTLRMARMSFYVAGSNSPAALAMKAIRFAALDELDKHPAWVGREADSVSLTRERTKNFPDRKFLKVGTPTTRHGPIWREFQLGDQRFYFVPCELCGAFSQLVWQNVRWNHDVPAEALGQDPDLTWFQCESCEGRAFDDRTKLQAMQAGEWRPTAKGTIGHASFHIGSIASPWVSLGVAVQTFLDAKREPSKLMNFTNSWQGWIFEEVALSTTEDVLERARSDYERATIPEPKALWLTAGVDVQRDYLRFVVRAWAAGERSWLVEWGRVEEWEDLAEVLLRQSWPRRDAEPLRVRAALIDSGFRTDEVYEFCRRFHGFCRPVKGAATGQYRTRGVPWWTTTIERSPRGKVLPAGLTLVIAESSYYKDQLARFMRTPEGEPGAWRVPRETDREYDSEVLSEHKATLRDRRRGGSYEEWQLKPGMTHNHYLDCEVYAMCAAEVLGVQRVRMPEVRGPDPRQPVPESTPLDEQRRRRAPSSWMGRRGGGWM